MQNEIMDEENAIKEAKDGNKEAFVVLYRKYVKSVYGFVYSKTGSREDSEDLTSEIWISILKSLPNFSADSTFKTWILAISKHKILDYYRKKYNINKLPLTEDIFIAKEFDEEDETHQKDSKIKDILNQLPEKYSQVLELRFLKGYSTKEIAREMGLSIENVKVIQYRALQKAKSFRL